MKQEREASGKTVEAAILNGAKELGVDREMVTYEIISLPKKGFLGFGEAPARVKVYYEKTSDGSALDFVRLLIDNMGITAAAEIEDVPGATNSKIINITGNDAGVLIGHHGETLDSLQYLANLVANKRDENESSRGYMKITVDIENYRAKREETLRQLARRMASKVLKYKKSMTLEPMNPYERRIIHSEIQNIEGVSTTSVGADNNRKIVIFTEDKDKSARPAQNRAKNNRQQASQQAKTAEADDTVES